MNECLSSVYLDHTRTPTSKSHVSDHTWPSRHIIEYPLTPSSRPHSHAMQVTNRPLLPGVNMILELSEQSDGKDGGKVSDSLMLSIRWETARPAIQPLTCRKSRNERTKGNCVKHQTGTEMAIMKSVSSCIIFTVAI